MAALCSGAATAACSSVSVVRPTTATSSSVRLASSLRLPSKPCALASSSFFSTHFRGTVPRQPAFRLARPSLIVTAFAAAPPVKKPDSAEKRARQSEKRRLYNKARKSEMSTRMKKVFVALDAFKKSPEPSKESLVPIERLIAEAFRIIDKSVKVGTIHRNKGANRKSRLSRAKRAVEIQLGWYTPPPKPEAVKPVIILNS